MEALLQHLQSNLESVTETAIAQAEELKQLKAQIAELKASNEKLTKDLAYESGMKKIYMKAYQDMSKA
jgi:cell division protein FtsB